VSSSSDLSGLPLGELRVTRASTAERAADVLRRLILRGELEPGAALRETHLARLLEISPNTTREALRILEREGVIVNGRHRVATVVRLAPRDVHEIFSIRRALELSALRDYQEAGGGGDLRLCDLAIARFNAFRDNDEWLEVIDADRDFHSALVALAGNPRLDALYAQCDAEIRLCLGITTRLHVSVQELAREHEALLDLLRTGEIDALTAALDATLTAARDRVIGVLSGQQELPDTPKTT
jgi:DNA-binding GntR family transcriptional regulator